MHSDPLHIFPDVDIWTEKHAVAHSRSVANLSSKAKMNRLNPGELIERNAVNDRLTSSNGLYTLVMQDDGNLVLYTGGNVLWQTTTSGTDAKRAVMQTDGNFVVYGVAGNPLWMSHTEGKPGCYLALQDDGNLVIYQPEVPVWTR